MEKEIPVRNMTQVSGQTSVGTGAKASGEGRPGPCVNRAKTGDLTKLATISRFAHPEEKSHYLYSSLQKRVPRLVEVR